MANFEIVVYKKGVKQYGKSDNENTFHVKDDVSVAIGKAKDESSSGNYVEVYDMDSEQDENNYYIGFAQHGKFKYGGRYRKAHDLVDVKFSKGGIPNNYAGKTAQEVWDAWTNDQRTHFLEDHLQWFDLKGKLTPAFIVQHNKIEWKILPEEIKEQVKYHVKEGQYARGGNVKIDTLSEIKKYLQEINYSNWSWSQIELEIKGILEKNGYDEELYDEQIYDAISDSIDLDDDSIDVDMAIALIDLPDTYARGGTAKAKKKYKESDFKNDDRVIWLQGKYSFGPQYRIGWVGTKDGKKGIFYNVLGAGSPMGETWFDVPNWADVKPVKFATSDELKNVSSGYARGGTMSLYHKALENINEKVYNKLLKEAKKDKEWALKTKNDKKWLDRASDMSKEMLKERLEKSVEQLAKKSYQYLYMRAHMLSDRGTPIDPSAVRRWEELSGEEIKYERGGRTRKNDIVIYSKEWHAWFRLHNGKLQSKTDYAYTGTYPLSFYDDVKWENVTKQNSPLMSDTDFEIIKRDIKRMYANGGTIQSAWHRFVNWLNEEI